MQRRYVYWLCCVGCEHVLSAYGVDSETLALGCAFYEECVADEFHCGCLIATHLVQTCRQVVVEFYRTTPLTLNLIALAVSQLDGELIFLVSQLLHAYTSAIDEGEAASPSTTL